MSTPVRYPNGVTNVSANADMASLIVPDPTQVHAFFDDFDTFTAADWTITTTEAGAGSATEALTNVDGGVLLITNDDADNDLDWFEKVGESFKFETGKKVWFKARFKVSDATQSDLAIGLQITDTPFAVSDGVFFQKDDGDTNLDFHVEKNDTATTGSAISTLADDTWVVVAFYYDGVSSVNYYVDGVRLGTAATTNLPDDEELTISFGLRNGEAAAKTMSVDYVMAIKER